MGDITNLKRLYYLMTITKWLIIDHFTHYTLKKHCDDHNDSFQRIN